MHSVTLLTLLLLHKYIGGKEICILFSSLKEKNLKLEFISYNFEGTVAPTTRTVVAKQNKNKQETVVLIIPGALMFLLVG